MSRLRLLWAIPAVSLALVSPLTAQGGNLRSDIQGLFSFGDCGEPLCLTTTANSATGHGTHFLNSTEEDTKNLLGFLSSAITGAVSNLPVNAATSGVTFRFEGGLPVQSSSSAGPIFGERVPTLGKGRFLVGANVTAVQFKSIRGVPLDNVAFTFTHQDTPPAGLGNPVFENDVIQVNTSIDLNLQVASLFATYGLFDRVDIGVAVPLVRADLQGGAIARVVPFQYPSPHFFGTAANPALAAATSASDNASGIGDIAARVKVNLGGTDRGAFGFLADVRFPTGNEDDFLGSGEYAFRGLAIFSARLGDFSPHLNAGYLYRSGSAINDAVLATAGFDHLVAPWATLAVDLITQWEVGTVAPVNKGPVKFVSPTLREVNPTNLPNRRDNLVDGSVGFKFLTRSGITFVTNALVPLNDGGVRGNWVGTVGIEHTF
jgi:hypothetical protein